MPASIPVLGAAMGVGIQLYVNAVRKLPVMRDPWLHVLWAGAGASFGTWLVGFEERTEKDLTGAGRMGLRGALQPPCSGRSSRDVGSEGRRRRRQRRGGTTLQQLALFLSWLRPIEFAVSCHHHLLVQKC